jgi:hypothetical protein
MLSGIVEEILILPWCRAIAGEHDPEGEVLETGTSSACESGRQPDEQPDDQALNVP